MGWFDEQIEDRKKHERRLLSDSFEKLEYAVTGRRSGLDVRRGADISAALETLLKYFGIREREIPPRIHDLEGQLDFLLSSSDIMYRQVALEPGWHKDAMGAMIVTLRESGAVVTVLRNSAGVYQYRDPATGKRILVNASEEKKICTDAYCFYRPLPLKKITLKDLSHYMMETISGWDLASFGLAALAITLVGMVMPRLNHILMDEVIATGSNRLLAGVLGFMFFATVGNFLLTIIRQLLLSRIRIKLNVNVQAASMMRVLSLPATFFKKYSSGELSQYLGYMNSLCTTLVDSIFSTAVTGVFSLVYLTQVFSYARSLVIPSLLVTILSLGLSVAANLLQAGRNKELMNLSAKEKGLTYSLIGGIEKIRLSGAENRAFAKWLDLYTNEASLKFNPPALIKLNTVITTAISLVGTIVMYYVAVKSGVSIADYYGFNTAYAYIQGAFTAISSVAVTAATVMPSLEIIRPLMEAEPEKHTGREAVTSITGSIELSHVTFRYEEGGRKILDDLSLTIPARQYVAIVGKTGCGKSTLMRLLLGFEKPEKGAIFFDRKDVQTLDMGSLRKRIGTVMQDGDIFAGSIYDNITISAPGLSLQEAWDAAEIAGIADEIRDMPMGMNTVLQEGGGGISGGQRQRLMIARAVAPKPKLLLLDEATSALDNITQKQVSEALDAMKCTRIVIAHRLSTIRHCDRILVLDEGKIRESGTYEELIAKGGLFADLVARQRLDGTESGGQVP
ncbi:MAG: ATP-binding cassette domain-containing protein [Blautia sp.]|nr:ATP-binding cassette domain-containing protein [Blautia sp.]